jgi:hypothetical protein
VRFWPKRFSKDRDGSFEERCQAAPPVLVYQFGKVGSSSLLDSLEAQWPGLVVHTHSFKKREGEEAKITFARETLQRADKRVFVISPVRELIGRNVSAFFQNFERETGVSEKLAHTLPMQQLIDVFLEKFPHDMPLNWFDDQLKVMTGIDVFEYKFPPLGVQFIRRGNIDLLLMQSEVPDWLKESAVEQFLGLDEFRIKAANIGERKPYAKTYRDFLHAFRAPDWYVQKMYGSRVFQHFYSEQREALTALWTRRPTIEQTAAAAEETAVAKPT